MGMVLLLNIEIFSETRNYGHGSWSDDEQGNLL